jgi:hypothetical protein
MVRRSTWILLGALAAAALAFFGWRAYGPEPAEPTPTLAPESPWSVLAEQVESIRVVDLAGSAVIVVERDAVDGWRVETPRAGPADAGSVEVALTSALAPVVRQVLPGGTGLEPFGLAPAQFRLTLFTADGGAHSLDVGAIDPTGSVYYAQEPGDGRVLLVSRFSLEGLLGMLTAPPFLATETPAPELSPAP